MKHSITFVLGLTALILLSNCTKKSDDVASCEENETTKVTFKNTRSTSVKLEVAITFNAQYVPNSPVVQIELAPGASTVREFRYGKYFIEWENGCPTACSQGSFSAKTFEQCGTYEVTY
jgi:hypothetical protein